MSLRESEKGSNSGSRGDGSTVSDGYSSKSVTTTHGIRSVQLFLLLLERILHINVAFFAFFLLNVSFFDEKKHNIKIQG